jgi:DNA-binding MarR family transcriptional regulator
MAQVQPGNPSEIQALLSEIRSLAIRLRQGVAPRPDGLPPGGQQVLEILLLRGEQTVPQIARLRGTSRQNIQILVNRLQTDGCVDLISNPAHKRSCLVRVTEKGSQMMSAARRTNDSSLAVLSSLVPVADVLSTTATLRRIRQTFKAAELPLPETPRPVPPKRKRAAPSQNVVSQETFLEEYQLPINLL